MKKIGKQKINYEGMPLAYLTAYNGYNVIGIDNRDETISKINNKIDIPKELQQINYSELNLYATKDYTKLKDIEVIIICVPTPTVKNKPDLTIMENVIRSIGNHIKKGCLIILESTVAPRYDQ